MLKDLTSEETTIVAVYSNRHYAEIARAFLNDQGVSSFIAADDVHPPLQMTEGVRLHVMRESAAAAHDALRDADMLPAGGSDEPARNRRDQLDQVTPRFTTTTVLLIVTGLLAAAVLVLAGLIIGGAL